MQEEGEDRSRPTLETIDRQERKKDDEPTTTKNSIW